MYTVFEVARILNVSLATIYRLFKQNKLDYVIVGKTYRVPKESLKKFMEKNLVRAK